MQTDYQCSDLTRTARNHHEQFSTLLKQTLHYFYKFRCYLCIDNWTQTEQLVQLISDWFPEISDIMLLFVWLQCV